MMFNMFYVVRCRVLYYMLYDCCSVCFLFVCMLSARCFPAYRLLFYIVVVCSLIAVLSDFICVVLRVCFFRIV